jgi:hypothetical protein
LILDLGSDECRAQGYFFLEVWDVVFYFGSYSDFSSFRDLKGDFVGASVERASVIEIRMPYI